jgi:3-deoxy-D-manno-octulosonate 8-phosphate phosphatase (KDO 8-P phosphatase)
MKKLKKNDIHKELSKIRLLSLDVDGVLTDGGLYYTDNGSVQRKFNVKDGVGIKRLLEAGVIVAIISAGISGSIPSRAKTLGIKYVFTGVSDKQAVLKELCQNLKIGLNEAAHIGDDINDVALLKIVGCPIAVADAQKEVINISKIVTKRNGGCGAVREICDALL